MKKEKLSTIPVYVCTNCNSDNVQIKAWVKPNENYKFFEEDGGSDNEGWCDDCRNHVHLETAQLKVNAKVIGFQVIGEEGTNDEGNIHPKMASSFCVYNLSQVNEMMNHPNKYITTWQLSTVWSGDIEEPTFMFKGNPRD